MIDSTLENHLLLSTSLLVYWLLSYSQNTDGGGGSLTQSELLAEGRLKLEGVRYVF